VVWGGDQENPRGAKIGDGITLRWYSNSTQLIQNVLVDADLAGAVIPP